MYTENKILDCDSKEFNDAYDVAFKKAEERRNRGNSNSSGKTSIDGYNSSIKMNGTDLAEATKKMLEEYGW